MLYDVLIRLRIDEDDDDAARLCAAGIVEGLNDDSLNDRAFVENIEVVDEAWDRDCAFCDGSCYDQDVEELGENTDDEFVEEFVGGIVASGTATPMPSPIPGVQMFAFQPHEVSEAEEGSEDDEHHPNMHASGPHPPSPIGGRRND
jgi:hypothetical protein